MRRIAVLGLSFLGVVLAVPAGATAGIATAKATPRLALVDGQTVRVNWTGFTGDRKKFFPGVDAVECTRDLDVAALHRSVGENATLPTYCDMSTEVSAPNTNRGSVNFTVVTGAVGTRGETCGTSRADRNNCEVLVYQPDNINDAIFNAAAATISFAFPG
jgi:hypothetical protein